MFASEVADRGGCNSRLISSLPLEEMGFIAKRPHYSVLKSERGLMLSSLEDALGRYFAHQEMVTL